MSKHPQNTLSLIADIGGTNTRVSLSDGPVLITDSIRRYRNSDFSGLEPILTQYFADEGPVVCKGACVDLAGLVRGGVGTMTNLDWIVDYDLLQRATGAEHFAILNDMQAQGHSVGHVANNNLRSIIAGTQTTPQKDATSLVVNVGTGFNAAAIFETQSGRYVAASECGHTTLPIHSQIEQEIFKSIEAENDFPAIEDVLSGRGLERLYLFLGTKANDPKVKDAATIMASVASGDDARADECIKIFTQILGAVCGNLALTHLPFGGIYLVGGVACAMAPYLDRFGFHNAFRNKGRFTNFMNDFSVSVIEDDYAALIGCAAHLHEKMP